MSGSLRIVTTSTNMGIFSSLPYFLETLFAIGFASFTDYLLRSEILSRTNIRKLAVFVNTILGGLLLGGLSFSGCNILYVLTLLTLTIMLNGACLAGTTPNLIDLSPNFTAILHGIQGFITGNTGYLAPLLVGYLTNNNKSIEQWNKVFLITSIISIITGILFLLFADSKTQPWNYEVATDQPKTDTKHLKIQEIDDNDDCRAPLGH